MNKELVKTLAELRDALREIKRFEQYAIAEENWRDGRLSSEDRDMWRVEAARMRRSIIANIALATGRIEYSNYLKNICNDLENERTTSDMLAGAIMGIYPKDEALKLYMRGLASDYDKNRVSEFLLSNQTA